MSPRKKTGHANRPESQRSAPMHPPASRDRVEGQSALSRIKQHRYRWLFLGICLFYLCTLTDKAFDWISDGQTMFDTAVSLHEFGELGISPRMVDSDWGIQRTTDYYGKYGLGLSVVEQVPLVFVTTVEKVFGEASSNVLFPLMNLLLTALTALLVALTLEAWGYRFRTGALAAIGFAVGTPAWPYVSYDFSEPLQSLCLILALWLLVVSLRKNPPFRPALAFAGFALGFAILTKGLLLIVIPGYILYRWIMSSGTRRTKLRNLSWLILSLALWAVIIGLLNWHRFGSAFEFGYGKESRQFITPILTGLYGLLISINKGLIFYAPLAIVIPWALWKMRSKHSQEVIFFLCVFVPYVAVNSKWWSWEGGLSWGPRQIMAIIPLVVVCAGTLLEEVSWSWPAWGSCVVAGILVNLLAVLMNFMVWFNVIGANETRLPLKIEGRLPGEYVEHDGQRWFRPFTAANYVPALSPILGHAWLLRLRYFGIPFPLSALEPQSGSSLPRVKYPPLEFDFSLLRNDFALSQLRSAHLWLWDLLMRRPREEIFSYPVFGVSLERQGDRALAKKDQERAATCFRRAMELMPNYASPALKLARLEWEQGDHREAILILQRYLEEKKKNLDQERATRLQLGQFYESQHYWEAAVEQYQIYLTLNPSPENRMIMERHTQELTARGR